MPKRVPHAMCASKVFRIPKLSEEMLRGYVARVEEKSGLVLKEKECEAICHFCHGNNVFVLLPAGYGKSVIYTVLPSVFNDITG